MTNRNTVSTASTAEWMVVHRKIIHGQAKKQYVCCIPGAIPAATSATGGATSATSPSTAFPSCAAPIAFVPARQEVTNLHNVTAPQWVNESQIICPEPVKKLAITALT